MPKINVLDHATVYRNPVSNLVSEYVAFPCIFALPDGSALCMCRHGTARESEDAVVKIHRSSDGGSTWEPAPDLPSPPAPPNGTWTLLPAGFGMTNTGDVLAQIWARFVRADSGQRTDSDQEKAPSPHFIYRSTDGGKSWSDPIALEYPAIGSIGPGGNMITLRDGTIIFAGEHGKQPGDDHDWISMTGRSHDGGHTWSDPVIAHISTDTYFFDLRITGSSEGKLLGFYWSHDRTSDQGLNVHTTWSHDAGMTWTEPHDTGFWGQVTVGQFLTNDRVIALTNHRRDPYGIRAVLSEDGGRSFDESGHVELWGIIPAKTRSAPILAPIRDVVEDPLKAYHHFTFGTPTVTVLPDGIILAAFYVTEQSVTYVRCCRMTVT